MGRVRFTDNFQNPIKTLFMVLQISFSCAESRYQNPAEVRNELFQKGINILVDNFKNPRVGAKKLESLLKENDIERILREATEFTQKKSERNAQNIASTEERYLGLQQAYAKLVMNLEQMAPESITPVNQKWIQAWKISN